VAVFQGSATCMVIVLARDVRFIRNIFLIKARLTASRFTPGWNRSIIFFGNNVLRSKAISQPARFSSANADHCQVGINDIPLLSVTTVNIHCVMKREKLVEQQEQQEHP